MRSFNRGLVIAAVLLVAALAAALLWPRPVPVDVAAVRRGRFVLTVEEDGKTRVRDRFVVSAPVAGTLLRIDRKAGEEVSRGELLCAIVPLAPPLLDARSRREAVERVGAAEAAVKRASATLERARTALAQEQTDLARARKLSADGVLSKSDLEKFTLAVDVREREVSAGEFELHLAEHELDTARTVLLRLRDPSRESGAVGEPWEIRSPVRGRVLRVLQESESVVATGTPLLELADPADLEVVVDLLTEDAVRVAPGARVAIERWGGDKPLEGRVRLVEPAGFTKLSALGVEEQRTNVIVDIVAPPEEWRALGDGYRVDARIELLERADALIVPSSALFRDGDRWAAYAVENGRARRRIVELGVHGERESSVESGLTDGEQVILYPGDAIAEGVLVAPRVAEAPQGGAGS